MRRGFAQGRATAIYGSDPEGTAVRSMPSANEIRKIFKDVVPEPAWNPGTREYGLPADRRLTAVYSGRDARCTHDGPQSPVRVGIG